MTIVHPLDRPAWAALTGRQADLAQGGPSAKRFAPDIAPFAGAVDASAESMIALAALPSPDETLWVVEAEPPPTPPGMMVATRAPCEQMVAESITPADRPAPVEVVDLADADAAEMLALATLTRPGPFSARTHLLGPFIGIRHGGRLVAMAGERMKPGPFTEVSGVCTHPQHRGAGYGGLLTQPVSQRILARAETPFLHVYATNVDAVRLYERLGFKIRRTVILTIFARA
jgi:predicted GNAT family acetyltransferase